MPNDDDHPSLNGLRLMVSRARSVVMWNKGELFTWRLVIGRAAREAVKAVGPRDEIREAVDWMNAKIKAFPLPEHMIELIVVPELESDKEYAVRRFGEKAAIKTIHREIILRSEAQNRKSSAKRTIEAWVKHLREPRSEAQQKRK